MLVRRGECTRSRRAQWPFDQRVERQDGGVGASVFAFGDAAARQSGAWPKPSLPPSLVYLWTAGHVETGV